MSVGFVIITLLYSYCYCFSAYTTLAAICGDVVSLPYSHIYTNVFWIGLIQHQQPHHHHLSSIPIPCHINPVIHLFILYLPYCIYQLSICFICHPNSNKIRWNNNIEFIITCMYMTTAYEYWVAWLMCVDVSVHIIVHAYQQIYCYWFFWNWNLLSQQLKGWNWESWRTSALPSGERAVKWWWRCDVWWSRTILNQKQINPITHCR